MKKKIVLTILAVSIVALLISGTAMAFYDAESDCVPITAQSAKIGVELCPCPINLACLFPGKCIPPVCRTFTLTTSCCPPGLTLYAKPQVCPGEGWDSPLAQHIMVTVKFDAGGAVYVGPVPLCELPQALAEAQALAFTCDKINETLWICFEFEYPETCEPQGEDMDTLIQGCYNIRVQTAPFPEGCEPGGGCEPLCPPCDPCQ